MTTLAQNREPSLRTRHPSSSTRPSRVARHELDGRLVGGDVSAG